jgi:hypothetical protein
LFAPLRGGQRGVRLGRAFRVEALLGRCLFGLLRCLFGLLRCLFGLLRCLFGLLLRGLVGSPLRCFGLPLRSLLGLALLLGERAPPEEFIDRIGGVPE